MTSDLRARAFGGLNGASECLTQASVALERMWQEDLILDKDGITQMHETITTIDKIVEGIKTSYRQFKEIAEVKNQISKAEYPNNPAQSGMI